MPEAASTWRFPATFWIANGVELFERAAYYGTFITLVVFLTRVVGFSDIGAGAVGTLFASGIYLLPFFTGALADRLGFRPSLILAFALLAAGYACLGLFPTTLPVLGSLALIVLGGSFVKPIITGTVAKSSDTANRARAYSLFYMMVNIGSFSGKTVAKPVRVELGLDKVPLYSAGAALVGLLLVVLLYWPKENGAERPRSASETLHGMLTALSNRRFLGLVLITAGFWFIQGQLYASMPKYVLRLVGEHASPEWYANVNPLVVVLFVVPITHLVRRLKPVTSIAISLALITVSPLLMASTPLLHGRVALFGLALHPITVMMVLGIAVMGISECFLSPRYLEYASKQAPAGQEGLYLGYAYLNTFFAWFAAFIAGGILLDTFCPEPSTLPAAARTQYEAAMAGNGPLPPQYAHANVLWFVIAGVGAAAFVCLLVYQYVTRHGDDSEAAAG